MSVFFEIGQRLKEERERIGLSQAHFAGIGDLTKQAQINYEQGKRSPDSAYLAALARHTNIDILFVITGNRSISNESMNKQEVELVEAYRSFGTKGKTAIDAMVTALKGTSSNEDEDNNKNDSGTYSSSNSSFVAQGENAKVIVGNNAVFEQMAKPEAIEAIEQTNHEISVALKAFRNHPWAVRFLSSVLFLALFPLLFLYDKDMVLELRVVFGIAAVMMFLAAWKMLKARKNLEVFLIMSRSKLKLLNNRLRFLSAQESLGF